MKFTFAWLCDHLDTSHNLTEICDALPMLGLEVEELLDPAAGLAPFRVVEITSAEQHPDADRLRVCQVNTGDETVQIVCGAPNARAGLKTIMAPVGSFVPGPEITIKKGNIRGQASYGMLCSPGELNLADDSDGITELPQDAPVGAAVASYVSEAGLYSLDPVIDIAITPNRGDCLGVRGVARDLAAAGYGTLKPLDLSDEAGSFDSPLSWQIDKTAHAACPLISGRMFEGVQNGASPDWMARRLDAVGQRPISALVDITNYVMIDLGRPLHAYDVDKIAGNTLTVRMAYEGEKILALNEKTYICGPEMLVIGDADGADDLAGIMGGERSGVSDTTTRMFLEIAIFDPISVATTGRKLNINSDARYRFERGLDITSPQTMAGYIARLVMSICGGTASHLVTAGTGVVAPTPIRFSPSLTAALTGVDCPEDRQAEILQILGCIVERSADQWQVTPAPWRNDIDGSADLVEEIIRIHGYDKLVMQPLPRLDVVAKPAYSAAQKRPVLLRRHLAGRGLTEAVTFSFLRTEDAVRFGGGGENLHLANPISADLNCMRPSLLPNLLSAAARNLNRGTQNIALFELGPIYLSPDETGQRTSCALLRQGEAQTADWQQPARLLDIFDIKQDLLSCLSALGVSVDNLQVTRDAPDYMHPGRSASLRLGKEMVGMFGELHPQVLADYDIKGPVIVCEFWLDNIPKARSKGPAKPLLSLSALQPVMRDFAFIVEADLPAIELVSSVRRAVRDSVTDVRIFDVYQGQGIEDGKKSVALGVTLQPQAHSFTEADLTEISDKIIATVAKNCDGVLRGA